MLTDSGFGFDSGSNSLRVASSGTISRALSAHPAGLRSTHCVFPPQSPGGLLLPVVLAPVLFASLFVQPCILHHASKNTPIVVNRFQKHTHLHNLAQTLFLFMHSSIAPCFLAVAHICRSFHSHILRCISIDFFQTLSPSFSYSQTDRHYSHVVLPRILLRLRLQREFAVVVAHFHSISLRDFVSRIILLRIILRLHLQRGVAVVVAKRCCRF